MSKQIGVPLQNDIKFIYFSKKDFLFVFLILLATIIVFWDIAFLQKNIKWDFTILTIPWRYYLGQCIDNLILPLWSPYQHLGLPFYFDPQTWYPISYFISLIFGYNIYSIHLEFIFHIFIAGIGVYFLASHFISDRKIMFISAIIVIFSGFFVGNAQHMGWVVSGAWIPLVLHSFLKIIKTKSFVPVFEFVLYLSLLLTGGYLPFFISTIYGLTLYSLYKVIIILKNKNFKEFNLLFTKFVLFFILFLVINIVTLLSLQEAINSIGRGDAITLERALGQSIEPKGLITFIFSYAITSGNIEFWGDEKTVMLSYFGVLSFFILFFALFIKKNKYQYVFLVSGILIFMITMGHIFPFRKIMYYTLPYFKFFRFPSLFRYFGILSFSLLVGITLSEFFNNLKLYNFFVRYLKVVVLILLLFLLFLVFKNNVFSNGLNIDFSKPEFFKTILFQGVIHLIILFLFLIVFKYVKLYNVKLFFIILLFFIDMFISVRLNSRWFVTDNNKLSNVNTFFKTIPKGFPTPDLTVNISEINNQTATSSIFWKNGNYFTKKISYDGVGPFKLKNFGEFEKQKFFNKIIENKLFYFADTIINLKNNIDTNDILLSKNALIFTDNNILLEFNCLKVDTSDINIIEFNPNKIVVSTYSNISALLVFMQNNYPYWNCKINGTKTNIYTVNYTLQAIKVPSGSNIIEFEFRNDKIIIAFGISFISFLLLLLMILILIFKKRK